MDIERRLDELKIHKTFRRWYQILKDDDFIVGRVSEVRMSKGFKTLGQCTKKADGSFAIAISRAACAAGDDVLNSVVCHELLHTIPGCFNHGAQFLGKAARIKYLYYVEVEAYTPKEHVKKVSQTIYYKPRKMSYKYKVICCNCGATGYAKRQNKMIFNILNHSTAYTCKKCGNNHFLVDTI